MLIYKVAYYMNPFNRSMVLDFESFLDILRDNPENQQGMHDFFFEVDNNFVNLVSHWINRSHHLLFWN